jgi:hypothetical protein
MAGQGSLKVAPVSAAPELYYIGLQPTDLTQTNNFFVDPNFTYNPVTGTLNVAGIQYRNAGLNTNGLARAESTYVDQTYIQTISPFVVTNLIPFAVTITPRSANSKIAIFVNWFGEHGGVSSWDTVYGLKRNGGIIGPIADTGLRTGGMAMAANSYYTASIDDGSTPESLSFWFLDQPNTTQPVTYQLTVRQGTGTLTLYTNRTVADANQLLSYERGTSSIIALETL